MPLIEQRALRVVSAINLPLNCKPVAQFRSPSTITMPLWGTPDVPSWTRDDDIRHLPRIFSTLQRLILEDKRWASLRRIEFVRAVFNAKSPADAYCLLEEMEALNDTMTVQEVAKRGSPETVRIDCDQCGVSLLPTSLHAHKLAQHRIAGLSDAEMATVRAYRRGKYISTKRNAKKKFREQQLAAAHFSYLLSPAGGSQAESGASAKMAHIQKFFQWMGCDDCTEDGIRENAVIDKIVPFLTALAVPPYSYQAGTILSYRASIFEFFRFVVIRVNDANFTLAVDAQLKRTEYMTSANLGKSRSKRKQKRRAECNVDDMRREGTFCDVEDLPRLANSIMETYNRIITKARKGAPLSSEDLNFAVYYCALAYFAYTGPIRISVLEGLTVGELQRLVDGEEIFANGFKSSKAYGTICVKPTRKTIGVWSSYLKHVRTGVDGCDDGKALAFVNTAGGPARISSKFAELSKKAIGKRVTTTTLRKAFYTAAAEGLSSEERDAMARADTHSGDVAERYYNMKSSRDVAMRAVEVSSKLLGRLDVETMEEEDEASDGVVDLVVECDTDGEEYMML